MRRQLQCCLDVFFCVIIGDEQCQKKGLVNAVGREEEIVASLRLLQHFFHEVDAKFQSTLGQQRRYTLRI